MSLAVPTTRTYLSREERIALFGVNPPKIIHHLIPSRVSGLRVEVEGTEPSGLQCEMKPLLRICRDLLGSDAPLQFGAQGNFALDARADVFEDFLVLSGPIARFVIDRTERAQNMPVGVVDRNSEIGDYRQVRNCEVVPQDRVFASIVDDQRLIRRDNILTKRMRKRGLAS